MTAVSPSSPLPLISPWLRAREPGRGKQNGSCPLYWLPARTTGKAHSRGAARKMFLGLRFLQDFPPEQTDKQGDQGVRKGLLKVLSPVLSTAGLQGLARPPVGHSKRWRAQHVRKTSFLPTGASWCVFPVFWMTGTWDPIIPVKSKKSMAEDSCLTVDATAGQKSTGRCHWLSQHVGRVPQPAGTAGDHTLFHCPAFVHFYFSSRHAFSTHSPEQVPTGFPYQRDCLCSWLVCQT